jgi:hypothetical protein
VQIGATELLEDGEVGVTNRGRREDGEVGVTKSPGEQGLLLVVALRLASVVGGVFGLELVGEALVKVVRVGGVSETRLGKGLRLVMM